ncbi:nicotinate-nucleotide--dimethylbenzimidazole phosphoribosyltransferase [Bacillus xiapuensis]|uniref:nicotinate-nucleotide--dimethylbenzimidazole phosphoribosyltransferase n=1 Tax=Bacillus xiapuensis TaxID=2014075 RepID=UPI0018E1EB88|nr:nicotinate-nucleotide--dimethylbenzimidazole phosphoribosyltransferase [Bacillus xiapuensis]
MLSVQIPGLDLHIGDQVKAYINTLTKPAGSLGRLEELALRLAEITGEPFPEVSPPGVIVFAADHGIVQEGVSAFPQEVTVQMVSNLVQGGAGINVFARQIGAKFKVVDVGVAAEVPKEGVAHQKIRYGTGNFLKEKAMTTKEAQQALQIGYSEARELIEQGVKCLIVGEVGIGNTTSSSAVLASLTHTDPAEVVGFGSGISNEQVQHKIAVVKQALLFHQPKPQDAIDILSKVGGLEMAAMAGAMLAAAESRIPILLDGFICTVSACLAKLIAPLSADYMIASHHSVEPGYQRAVSFLGKMPLIHLQMRLGEGTGAAVAFPLLQSAVSMVKEMATFEQAGVSTQKANELIEN